MKSMWDLCCSAGDIVELVEGLTSEGLTFSWTAHSRLLHHFLLSREGVQQLWGELDPGGCNVAMDMAMSKACCHADLSTLLMSC